MKYLTVSIGPAEGRPPRPQRTEVQEAIRVWVDGRRLGIVLEGTVRTPLVLRGEQALRESAADLERVQLVTPTAARSSLVRLPRSASKTDRSRSPPEQG